MSVRFDIYQSRRRWTRGGSVVREWDQESFDPIAAESRPIRDGMTMEVDPCPAPTCRVVAPDGSRLVDGSSGIDGSGERFLQFGPSRTCISAGIAHEYGSAGRFTLAIEPIDTGKGS
jgi:hypothetical protein